jgi:hypothetical protein
VYRNILTFQALYDAESDQHTAAECYITYVIQAPNVAVCSSIVLPVSKKEVPSSPLGRSKMIFGFHYLSGGAVDTMEHYAMKVHV